MLQSITECLAETEVSQSEYLPLLRQLITCIAAVIEASTDMCSELSLILFTIILRVRGSKHVEHLQQEASNIVLVIIYFIITNVQPDCMYHVIPSESSGLAGHHVSIQNPHE